MKNLILIFTVFLAACSGGQKVSQNTEKKTYKNERVQFFSNGLKVYFIQDDNLPKIEMQMLIPVGVGHEPKEFSGLHALTARVLDKGTQNKKALEIADQFADSGSDFDISAGYDFTMAATSALVTEFPKVLNLFIEILTQPVFPQEEINRERELMIVQLQGRKDRSGPWADYVMNQTFYQGHEYGQDLLGTPQSLKKIKKEKLLQFYKKYYQPQPSILAVSGRLTPEIEKLIQEKFETWKNESPIPKKSVLFNAKTDRLRKVKIETPHKAQTEIRIIQQGIPRTHPDFLKYRIANEILGGSFASRLNQKIRDDLGLTYSIGSYLDPRASGGAWVVSTFSKNETAEKTISEIQTLIQNFAKNGITKDELNAAKNLAKAQLPRSLETSDKLAYNLLLLDFYGLGAQYLIQFNQKIDAITVQDVNAVVKNYFKPEQLEIMSFN